MSSQTAARRARREAPGRWHAKSPVVDALSSPRRSPARASLGPAHRHRYQCHLLPPKDFGEQGDFAIFINSAILIIVDAIGRFLQVFIKYIIGDAWLR